MTDASFRSVGYALMIEDSPDYRKQSKRKTYAPVAFGSKCFSSAQVKMSFYSKDFLKIYMSFREFEHTLWKTTKPTSLLSGIKSDTRSSQTKATPPSFWNACDYVLKLILKIPHIAGPLNTTAYFICRQGFKVTEKRCFKIREDIQTTPIEVTTFPSDVTDEEPSSFTEADNEP